MPQLIGQTRQNVGVLYHGPLARLRRLAASLREYAIYRDTVHGYPFHNSTDERYLIEHDSPYWRNRGY